MTQGSMITKFIAAKKAYVPHPILSNMGPVTMTCRSAIPLARVYNGTFDEEIPQPVARCAQSICRSSNSKRSDLSGVQPSHTQPADREPGVEQKEAKDRNDLSGGTVVADRVVKSGEDNKSKAHGGAGRDHQLSSSQSFD